METTGNKRMTPRERLLAPFRGIKPDRPAWLADLSYWHEAALQAGTNITTYAVITAITGVRPTHPGMLASRPARRQRMESGLIGGGLQAVN